VTQRSKKFREHWPVVSRVKTWDIQALQSRFISLLGRKWAKIDHGGYGLDLFGSVYR
jgi:hypothetical protein